MAKTDIAKSYDGVVTLEPTTINRLHTLVESTREANLLAITKKYENEMLAELEQVRGASKVARQRRIELSTRRDSRIKHSVDLRVGTDWTVYHSDDSTITKMTFDEVLELSNMGSRQITGVKVQMSGILEDGGLELRFDARKRDGVSSINVNVSGQQDHVLLVFGKLNEIVKSALVSSPMRDNSLMPTLKVAVVSFFVLAGLLALWKFSGHSLTDNIYGIAWGVFVVAATFGGIWFSYLIEYLYPSWNCTIGDGMQRYERAQSRRQIWFQYVFGSVILAGVIGYLVNKLSSN